ncbi:alpha-(1,3)-fucosyltransferase C [Lingula anatina]|uniref:Fucosyltransferase n=1 Tax=Lingula anatina TaxID=7574 RepID=A0A1S3JZT1_LINAN|nr:alpha-(1,3)-fucosyltransferase C [Lingula anatina]XP_013415795.1 alpha-(1,3)-fucosyltransferase C [Lingula anatina]XP_013415796.1 alpha-(1,3)-fucosyltransferase C [Lingula anatina]XP_013415797.1 alpha-(1,3)-fucosyltransferase C [Lingula anatina]XP_013415798.1 alpha-(1,3)-fucosyltransferase C [Lingula anatina]XP_013415799.1 alpha-(1,3)-fucosyltransferase C [Lingula anatina]XP_013415800.1 alpha-(1,3)-fucosyltransferase C [Lingula anatina]XP_013415802.1 alpha-(1,3)-fucosyltransferase C [Ling|eukprot:XP_013415794.1 alpha-(1,3)-fucosyltransferase C [Lingula anatina]
MDRRTLRGARKWLFYGWILTSAVLMYLYLSSSASMPNKAGYTELANLLRFRIILFWNDQNNVYGLPWYANDQIFGPDSECPTAAEGGCWFTKDRRFLEIADVIIFNIPEYNWRKEEVPKFRLPHQRWVMWTHESPCYSPPPGPNWGGLENKFNWTLTYRKDSDIFSPYGYIVKRDPPLNRDFVEVAKKKKKLVAWMSSHCPVSSKRDEYVKELQKYIPVDIYGSCGTLKCGKEKDSDCLKMISDTYKFYLSFENSISTDYVTEKFYKMVDYDVVTILRGGTDYSRLDFQKEWYISTGDFKSPKELAEHLKKLDANVEEYAKLLNWKNHYTSKKRPFDKRFCELCRRADDPKEPIKWWTRDQLVKWFWTDECKAPTDM